MTREEYYAGIEAYKNKLEHRAIDANAEDTAGKALENWKNQYLNQAINLRAKQYLASKSGRTDDASTYEKQLQILLDKMTNLKGVSLSAKQALMQTIDQTATNKANVQYAKHSDESDEVLEHGGEWKKHKYIRIENGRYIYPEDLKKDKTKSDPNEAKEKSRDINAKYYDYYAKRGQDAVQFFGSRASNKTEAVEGYEEAFALGKRMAEQGARESAVSRAQASGMRRTNALKEGLAKNEEHQSKKESFAKETTDVAKANEERKERAVNNNNQSVQTARSQSDESAAKAQKDGEAMQAWKNAKALKEAAKKGEGESYEKAQREGEAMDKYNRTKNIPYTEAWWNEEEKRLKAISAKQDRNFATITTETANGSKDANKSKSNENARAEIEETGSISKNEARETILKERRKATWGNKEEVAKEAELKNSEAYRKALSAIKDAPEDYKKEFESAWKDIRTAINERDKNGVDSNTIPNITFKYDSNGLPKEIELMWEDLYGFKLPKAETDNTSVVGMIRGIRTDSVKAADKYQKDGKKRTKNLKHSLNLTREEYYAGIEEYKRKKSLSLIIFQNKR